MELPSRAGASVAAEISDIPYTSVAVEQGVATLLLKCVAPGEVRTITLRP